MENKIPLLSLFCIFISCCCCGGGMVVPLLMSYHKQRAQSKIYTQKNNNPINNFFCFLYFVVYGCYCVVCSIFIYPFRRLIHASLINHSHSHSMYLYFPFRCNILHSSVPKSCHPSPNQIAHTKKDKYKKTGKSIT